MAANQKTTRIHNKREIIDMLLASGEVSRTGLATSLGLSKPATAEHIEGLIRMGLVEEIGEGTAGSTGGRKPRLLHLNKNYNIIAAIDISFTHPVVALGNLAGEMLGKKTLKKFSSDSAQNRIEAILSAISELMSVNGISDSEMGMVIISSPGIFQENSKLFRINPQFRDWVDLGLDKILEDRFSVPVMIKNDMSIAALGEFTLGCGGGCSNMVYASCGMGLGAGIVIDGKLYEGKNFAAGEIGYFTNRQRYTKGHFIEQYVTIGALLKRTESDIKAGKVKGSLHKSYMQKGKLEFDDIVSASQRSDEYVTQQLIYIGEELGYSLANIASLLDIERLVLGGDYGSFFHIIKQPIEEILRKCTPVPPELLCSELGDEAGLYGGFIIGRNTIFENFDL